MTQEEFISKVWGYYIMLENSFINTFQYVEPVEDNNYIYSKEYSKLLLSICSEVDIICKELCKLIENKDSDAVSDYNIDNYRNVISKYNNFLKESCTCLVNHEVLEPWSSWEDVKNPSWWKDYNKLKHDRLAKENYKLGNFINVKNSLAGLYILCRIYYKYRYKNEPLPKSNLFMMNNWTSYVEIGGGFGLAIGKNGVGLRKIN